MKNNISYRDLLDKVQNVGDHIFEWRDGDSLKSDVEELFSIPDVKMPQKFSTKENLISFIEDLVDKAGETNFDGKCDIADRLVHTLYKPIFEANELVFEDGRIE